MPSQITNYQCPRCGGPLHFDSALQKMKCDFCDSTFTNEEVEALFAEKNEKAEAQGNATDKETQTTLQWTEDEATHMRAYTCPSCGAQLIADENTAATSCPYCGNPTIVPSQFSGHLKPDYIIPFKLDKNAAKAKLKEFYGGKPLLPAAFTDRNHIEEIKGVYVPFWLFDGLVGADGYYTGEKSKTHKEGNEEVTETDFFSVYRGAMINYEKIPTDASTKMPDDFMDSLEPFDFKDLVPFENAYLPGYLADKYDVSAEDSKARAELRMRNTALETLQDSLDDYSSTETKEEKVKVLDTTSHYAYLPIWMLTTQYDNKRYMFAMNGQTGKMIGDDLPVDKRKMFLYFIAITLGMMAVLAFLLLR